MNVQLYTAAQLGGFAKAKKIRETYNRNPNKCLHCGLPLLCDEQANSLIEIRKKKFCNSSCAASYNNHKKPKRIKKLSFCHCGAIKHKEARQCKKCSDDKLLTCGRRTKGEIFESSKTWQSARTTISSLARQVYRLSGKTLKCKICGYDKHVDISHIKAVSTFDNQALLSEICALTNLQALCPNHHWEHDNL